ncbi:hypothetical protein [Pseudactinotalea sp. Z1748]|uniref:hypothetical protein n=1 Tax=Pseudactinotalea sp. Z1748 TaxID=3413027 RepID=UPI003C7D1679
MRAKRNSRTKRTDAWVDHLAEAPRADLPEDRSMRRARWTRRYVWAAVILLVPSLLVNIFIVFGNPTAVDEEDSGPAAAGVMDPLVLEARALATATVSRWLASEPSPLPGGRLMSWNYAEDVESVAPVQTNNDGQEVPWDRILMHDMTITNGTTVFSVRLNTSADLAEGVHVIGTPSLVPYAPASSSGFSGPVWPGAQTVTTTDSISESINQWARAFTGGDPSALRLAVGDPEPNHAYMPMVGAELADTNIVSATVQEHMLGDDGRPPAEPEQVVVRVELTLQWPANEDEEDETSSTRAAPITYDVLVDRANTASPDVVAWGGPGQGPELIPYANAVVGRSLQVREGDSDDDASDLQGEEDQDAGEQSDEDAEEAEEEGG